MRAHLPEGDAAALGGLVVLTLFLSAACGPTPDPDTGTPSPSTPSAIEPAAYVGSEACGACHATSWTAWRNSHHDRSLELPDAESVLGGFDDTHLDTEFRRNGNRFQIKPHDAEAPLDVVYTFGVTPLQQYVIPAGSGALSTYPIAWDSRIEALGGQRWFNLVDAVYPAGDPMHWAGRANRWNSQCADCHSTGVRKSYDPVSGVYATTFAVEDVGCEACHGPGSSHAADPSGVALVSLLGQHNQIEACAPCHSRRTQLAEGFRPGLAYLDHYAPSLVTSDLYHVDGQIDDEVYVYGSFLQSRMHRSGVTCSNCHDPHSATLRRPGNATCTHCHQASPANEFAALAAGSYDSADHHFHVPDSPGAQCVACHMPEKVYMGVDGRRDHGFRVPRPDLTVILGVPNACNGCHEDRSAAWASAVIEAHFGRARPEHFANAFARADAAVPGADADLAWLVADDTLPVMVRASALTRLGAYQRGYTLDAIRLAARGEPLLRYAAPGAAASLAADSRWRLLAPLLEDELRAVRHEALVALLPTASDRTARDRLAPYVAAWLQEQTLNLDQPETLTGIAQAQVAMGKLAEAEHALREALALQSSWVPGLMNLADLYRLTGRDDQAGPLIEKALTLAPDRAEVAYGYGLWLSRQSRLSESLTHFQRAAALAPDQSHYAYAHALALNDGGNGEDAVAVLLHLLERWSDDQDALYAAVAMLRDQQRYREALPLLDRLIELRPTDRELVGLREVLAAAAAAG